MLNLEGRMVTRIFIQRFNKNSTLGGDIMEGCRKGWYNKVKQDLSLIMTCYKKTLLSHLWFNYKRS